MGAQRGGLIGALAVVFAVAMAAGGAPAVASTDVFDRATALKTSQRALGRAVGDYAFRTAAGEEVRLSDYRGKPLVISFVYTACAHACPVITENLVDALGAAWDALGADSFRVVTVGFDVSSDTPERMATFARQHGIRLASWDFLSGELPQVIGLVDDVGFQFARSAKGFDHISQTTILDGEGRVYRQIYGESFPVPFVVQPLKELVFNTPTPFQSVDELVKKVRWFCTIYDPVADRYRFDYSIFIRLAVGAAAILGVIGFLARELWRHRRRRMDMSRPAA